MSFPYHDRLWCEVADFVGAHLRPQDRILANDLFWWRFDEIFRYANLHLDPQQEYDWVVLHKGELNRFPMKFLRALPERYIPVFANPVFVIWAARREMDCLTDHPDFNVLAAMFDQRAAQTFEPQPADDLVLPVPGRIGKLERLSKIELAGAMDRFYEAGGYEYVTRRDKVYYDEINRWVRVFCSGLENGDILDVACGDGRVARAMNTFRTMIETDLSSAAVALAARAGAGDPRRMARVMDAEKLDFPGSSFDAVSFVEGAEHVHDFGLAVGEAVRVLRPGGVFIMTTANADSLHQRLNRKLGYPYFKTNYQHVREYPWRETREILEQAGLEIERAEGVFLYPYWGVPGVDHHVRELLDNDAELVEAMRALGERAGPDLAYCVVLRARKRA